MIKQIQADELMIGMYIADLKASWFKTPFLTHTFHLKTEHQIKQIVDLKCRAIYIDTGKGLDVGEELPIEPDPPEKLPAKEHIEIVDTKPEPVDLFADMDDYEEEVDEDGAIIEEVIPYTAEIEKAKEVRNDVENVVSDVMSNIKLGKAVDTENVANVAKNMVESIYRNKNAITSLSRLKDFNEYTFNHCVNVAILSATFGRHLGMSKKDVTILGMGGMLHDLGKMKVPESILNKPGSFTPEEFEIMKMHVNYTIEILDKSDDVPDAAKKIAAEHHERCDGRGYPFNLKEEGISIYGKIGAIVDVYDAITSDRVYHTARLPFDALRFLFTLAEKSLHKPLVESFIQCIGIYPIGSYVLLSTNEIGVVVSINKTDLLRPNLRIMINNQGFKMQSYPLVSLTEKSNNGYKRGIVKSIHESEYDLPLSTELPFLN